MAKITRKRRVKKNIESGIVHIQSTFNNTIVMITDVHGNALAWSSAGALGFKGSPKYYVSNFYAIGANIGSSIAFCDLQQNKIQAFADTFSMERFFYWKLSVAYNNRFVFIKAKERSAFRPCFLDLSIGYNLPLAYRYVGIKKETKSVVRHIANFNDFSAMARLGFGVMAITAEYRLTNNIKPQYGTVPNLMFGLEIIFHE